MKQLLKQEGKCSLFKVAYDTRFEGCQCFKDCDCMEEWKKKGNPKRVTQYNVFDGKRTRKYSTLENAEIGMQNIIDKNK